MVFLCAPPVRLARTEHPVIGWCLGACSAGTVPIYRKEKHTASRADQTQTPVDGPAPRPETAVSRKQKIRCKMHEYDNPLTLYGHASLKFPVRKRQFILFLLSLSATGGHQNLFINGFTVNECDWHIFAGNDERIESQCFIRYGIFA